MPRTTFALNAWSAELRSSGWYYGDTYREEKGQFRGPYSSIASVTLMIAREMTREILRRQQRMEVPHAAE
jgi:hypothetical protein